ncbi:hypothetical protein AKJ08_3016 [Vulgatibacter incomptus]|uniref:Uncharacterized protein n=1 Tax=Vulgatibacter incomptus TaxID=1391653 RepID=A0A0K1PHN9_9BACT|nr:hypothetical protein AKJ08_3016 [Vulgatibacter incomptus]
MSVLLGSSDCVSTFPAPAMQLRERPGDSKSDIRSHFAMPHS